MLGTVFVLIVSWGALIPICSCVEASESLAPNIKAFHVYPNTQGEQTVAYKISSVVKSPKEVLDTVHQQQKCLEKQVGSFLYKVCFGGEIEQIDTSTPNTKYLLGKFVKYSDDNRSEKYEDGTRCPETRKNRMTTIKYVCGLQIEIVSVSEGSVCVYEISISTPDACNNPEFMSAGAGASGDDKKGNRQPWYLELTQLDDNSFMCIASHSGYFQPNSGPVAFASFSLSFSTTTEENGEVPITDYVVRGAKRVPLLKEEVNVAKNGLQSTNEFLHVVNYAAIQSKQ